jgi:hypothetical protein
MKREAISQVREAEQHLPVAAPAALDVPAGAEP